MTRFSQKKLTGKVVFVHKHTCFQITVLKFILGSKGVNVMGLRVNEKQNFVEKSIFTD